MSLLGRLSIVGALPPRSGTPVGEVLRRSRAERTLPVVCRNLGIPCDVERAILARQLLARHQAEEIGRQVEMIPLKGLYLAHHLYPSPGLRDMGDLDLLVRRLPEADAALRAIGYVPEIEPERLVGTSLNAVEYWRENSMAVHLHWRVSNGSLPHFMYRVDGDEIWREARNGVMARHHLVVTLCEHALKHSFSELILLTDIELASRDADGSRVAETARRWGLEDAVTYAFVLLREVMGVVVPALDLPRARPGGEGRLFLQLARWRRWNGLSALGLLSMARGTRQKARFVREALAPGRAASAGFSSRTLSGRLRRATAMIWEGLLT
jgi:hypothetical protein